MKNLVCLLVVVICCCQGVKESPARRSDVPESPLFLDSALFATPELHCPGAVMQFYRETDYRLFWSLRGSLNSKADSLIRIIENVEECGLNPTDYHWDNIQAALQDSLPAEKLSRIDLLLTDGYFALRKHLQQGRLDPRTLVRRDLSGTFRKDDITQLQAADATSISRFLRSVEPNAEQYHALKDALKAFRLLGNEDSIQRIRAARIALNLERWRWQKPLPERYVFVNIPAFLMRVVENDSVWLESSVIVGKRETPTPVMQSVIRSFIIYPYWHVPNSIATRELLPALQHDASYLRHNNFDVLNKQGTVINPDTIQWKFYSPDHFPFILRQREGSENSMGIIKFNFANHYNVYLHDTNSKRLFERRQRDLSHGCVRVKLAVPFAHFLVREDDIYVSPEDLDQYLSLQQRLKIDLRKPITLILEYFTVEVERGVTLFHDDIYKKDSLMMQGLQPDLPFGMPVNEEISF